MRTLVVGDVHGCSAELGSLVAAVRPKRVVLVGDLFTKGPDPAGVWRLIRDHHMKAVLGNHDARLLKAMLVPGKDPAADECVVSLDHEDMAWRAWCSALPLFRKAKPFTVVHAGLHPSGSKKKTTPRMALSLRRFPNEDAKNRLWYRQYRGERRVIFGHDAARGLVRVEREGAPWLIGLDSGCVYGGHLSGYLVEEDHVVQVPALRTYRKIELVVPRAKSRR